MFDPLTLMIVGGGVLAFREMNRKDYGILTPSRDERYRLAMEHCYDPDVLMQEARLFAEYGLKAQAAMLKRRAEWRGRPEEVKKAHEAVFQKALKSTNTQGILEVALAFEGWTATKKAGQLYARVKELEETRLQSAAQNAAQSTESSKKGNGVSKHEPIEEPITELVTPIDDI